MRGYRLFAPGFCLLLAASLGAALPPPAAAPTIRTLIGPGQPDGLPASQVALSGPTALALGADGTLYMAEVYPPRIVKIGPDGRFGTVAGTGVPGSGGDGGPAAQAQLREPVGLAVDRQGTLYVADDADGRVRRIDPSGTISTFVGRGAPVRAGTTVSLGEGMLVQPTGLSLDAAGNLFIADVGACQIFRVDPAGTTITAVAGHAGQAGFAGDDGFAVFALLNHPAGVFVDTDRSVYIADDDNDRVRRITPDGLIHTVAGGGHADLFAGPATELRLDSPNRVVVDRRGVLWIVQATTHRVRSVTPNGTMTTVAGNGVPGFTSDQEPPTRSLLNYPFDLVLGAAGQVIFTDTGNNRLRAFNSGGSFTTIAGGPGGSGLPAAQVRLLAPGGGVTDSHGNRYVADSGHHRVLRVSPAGTVDVYAGRGAPGYFGDGGPATAAGFGNAEARTTIISGLAVDARDNLYIGDALNFRIRRVSPDGTITTVVGHGEKGFGGDNGPATAAKIGDLAKLCVDRAGDLFFVDRGNHRVRKVDTGGTITTVAGNGSPAYAGDGGRAVQTGLPGPDGVYAASDGSLLITDIDQPRLYRVDPSGTITTLAGTGVRGSGGDGALAVNAQLDYPEAVVGDAAGSLYLAERYLNAIRRIDPAGVITTIAGTGNPESTGDGGPAAQAGVWRPIDLAVDSTGALAISELGQSHRLRLIEGLP